MIPEQIKISSSYLPISGVASSHPPTHLPWTTLWISKFVQTLYGLIQISNSNLYSGFRKPKFSLKILTPNWSQNQTQFCQINCPWCAVWVLSNIWTINTMALKWSDWFLSGHKLCLAFLAVWSVLLLDSGCMSYYWSTVLHVLAIIVGLRVL